MDKMKKRVRIASRVFSAIGMGVGLLAQIFGIVLLSDYLPVGSFVRSSITFGADYYTDSYTAMAHAANNIVFLALTVSTALGYVLIVTGMALMTGFTIKFVSTFIKKEAANQAAEIPVQTVQEKTIETPKETNKIPQKGQREPRTKEAKEALKFYKELLDSGAITQEQYDQRTNDLLK